MSPRADADIWHTCWILIKDDGGSRKKRRRKNFLWKLGNYASLNFHFFLLVALEIRAAKKPAFHFIFSSSSFYEFLDKYSTINFGVRFLMLVAASFVPVFWDQLTNLNVNFTTNAPIESMLLNLNGICMAADESLRLLWEVMEEVVVLLMVAHWLKKKNCVLNFQLFGVAVQSKQ